MIKAVLLDFDGTLVTEDILDIVCGIVGKEEESRTLNQEFLNGSRPGRSTLIERINLLKGITINQIEEKIKENLYLTNGAKELIDYCNNNNIITILSSGNIEPILEQYKNILGIDYIVGTKPVIQSNSIIGISEENFPDGNWKLIGIKSILNDHSINAQETIAIGDSPSDIQLFEFAGTSIAINPKHGVEKHAHQVIHDLFEVISIINKS